MRANILEFMGRSPKMAVVRIGSLRPAAGSFYMPDASRKTAGVRGGAAAAGSQPSLPKAVGVV